MSQEYERLLASLSLEDPGLRVLPMGAVKAFEHLDWEKKGQRSGVFLVLDEEVDNIISNVSAGVAFDLDDPDLSKFNLVVNLHRDAKFEPEDVWRRIEQSYQENQPEYQFSYVPEQEIFRAAKGKALLIGGFQGGKRGNAPVFYWESFADVADMDSGSFIEHYKLLGEVLEATLTAIYPSFNTVAPKRRFRFGLDL